MAVQEESLQYSLRIGDTVLLYADETNGYVFSELSSSKHNSAALFRVGSQKDPNLPNVHFATFKVVAANKYKSQERLSAVERQLRNREPSTAEKGVLLQAQRYCNLELRENEAKQERLQGNAIVYGEKVQLLHTLTKKYLTVNTRITSRTENTSLRVELQSGNSEGSIFKILPRYKVRSVGDEVRYNDQVKFESVKTDGQFLHCSAKLFRSAGFNVLANCHELNLSATESALTIIPHYRPMIGQDPHTFRAGGSVRLFHREYECYIAAEGSFAEDPAVVEDVHCRKRHSDHGLLKLPSTSANTYWQFEKESDPCSGEPLSWGERCRIKHLPTRKYLAVVQSGEEYKLTLKDRSSSPSISTTSFSVSQCDLDTVFSLFPVIKEGDTILLESYARIKHLQTRTWLHLEKGKRYERRMFDPNAPGLEGLEWDSAELFMLSATETMNYDDAFTLEQVEESLVDKFNTVAGIVPILTTHVKERAKLGAPPLDEYASYRVSSALKELSEFLSTPSARDSKNRQKLLRNLRVLELVIEVLKLFKLDAKDASEQKKVCQACYLVIESYLKGGSRKNENYLARFINFFQTQVHMGLNAEEVMIEMVEDNASIVSKMAETELDYMIHELVKTKDHRIMVFLGNLCVCGERPIPSNQNAILEKLVNQHGKDVFYQMEVGGSQYYPMGEPGVVYFKKPGVEEKWQKLSDIAATDMAKSVDYEFLKSQLQLFSKICKGNNAPAITALDRGYLTFQKALQCARNEDLHPSLRSKYVELIKVMFVDVGENRNFLENLSLSFVYDWIQEDPSAGTGKADTVALTGVENIYFPQMRDWILEHIKGSEEVVVSHVEDNLLLAEVLSVLALLVKYGYYDDKEDVDAVLHPLLDVLNGFKDLLFPASEAPPPTADPNLVQNYRDQVEYFKTKGRYQETQQNLAMFAIKERAVEVMELFFNFRFYVRLQRFIYDFRVLKGDVVVEGEGSALGTIPPLDLHDLLQLPPGKQIPGTPLFVQVARERLKFIFSQSAYFFEAPIYTSPTNTPFPDILLDLSCYNSNELVQGSMHLLNQYYSAEETLFYKAIQTQLLVTDESRRVFAEIRKLLTPLRRHLSVSAGESQRLEIINILNTFTRMCVLQEDDEEPHPQNQKILYSYGVLSDVLNYVLLRAKDAAEVGGRGEVGEEKGEAVKSKELGRAKTAKGFMYSSEGVLVACFSFLKALAKNNIEVQRRLYDRMDELLEIDLAIPYIAEILTEVFTGGVELCLKVREEQVEKLFQMVTSVGEDEGRAELILTLQAIAKVEDIDLPVKRNQAFIIKFFSKTRAEFCDHLLGEGMEKERWKLLTQEHETPDLRLLLAMTDLLASCSEGENFFIESVCQTVYSVEELLKILQEPYLPPERKRPFARFLVWVYLNTGGDKIQSGASELAKSKGMWEYLEHLASLLSNIGDVLRVMPRSESKLVRQGLSSASRRLTVRSDRQRKSTTPHTQSKAIPFVTGNDGRLLPGLLLYFSDGLLPLLKSFYGAIFNLHEGGFNQDRRMQVSGDILSALLHLCDPLMQYFTMDSQVKLYRGTILTIMNSGHGELPVQVEEKVFATFNDRTLHHPGIVSAAREAYNKYFSAEIDLNETFNRFVSNYRLAYQGPNTARAQVGAKFDAKYSEIDDELKKPGDEYLPLGPSFQDHVACFVRTRTFTVSHRVKPEAEHLIKQLEISFGQVGELEEKERQRQVELDIKSLQILRAIIHNEIILIPPNLKEENSTSFRKRCVSRVQPIQNVIQDFGNAVSRVIPLLSHRNDEIVTEVLAFLKAILFSGNRHVQDGMEHLLFTREEQLFITMRDLLTNAAITYRERQTLVAQMEARLATEKMLVDSFNSFRRTKEPKPVPMIELPTIELPTIELPTIAVDIDFEDVKGGEVIALASITHSLPRAESSLSVTQPRLSNSLESSPLLSPSLALTTTDKRKGKPHRERASSKQSDFFENPATGTLLRNSLAHVSMSKQDKGQGEDLDVAVVELLLCEDPSHVKLALQVLGLMCDGQYRLTQNYLREQRDNIHTINLVGEVALFIQYFCHNISVETVELVHLILQTLTEMCVGNYPNQAVIFNRQILEALNSIFQIDIADGHGPYTVEDSVNLKASAVELLEVMLEETSDKSSELVDEIAGGVDIAALHDTLADFYELMSNPEVKQVGFTEEVERGLFRTYHVLVHLRDYKIPSSIKEQIEPQKEASTETRNAWEFCKNRSRSVEVFYRNMDGDKILTRLHFQFQPENKFREDLVERVKWNVNRDSPEDKLRDFLDWMKAVKKETIHQSWLHKNWLSHLLISFPRWRHYILIFLSFLMNLFLLITYQLPDSVTNMDGGGNGSSNGSTPVTFEEAIGAIEPLVDNWFPVILYLFGAIHLFFSLWMLTEYFLINWKNFVLPRFFYIPTAHWYPAPDETYSDVNIFGLQTVYVALFVLASILSMAFWGYFYCFCLLHIVVHNDILQRVLRSVTKNGIALLWVAILGVVVLYIYSVVSFAFLHESFLAENDDAVLFCDSLFQCLISVLRYGLIDNLGLAVPLVPEEWRTAGLRLFYDLSFFIIVTTIGLNIVFGIIVDTFSELRDERYHTEQDKKAFCFICSNPSHEFERRAKGFDHHVKNDHNMWDYIHLSIYLDRIDISDHNAIESYVYNMIHDGMLEFFPLLVALALGKEEDETAHHLEELKTMVKEVLDHFKAEKHKTTLRNKLQEQAIWEEQNLLTESTFGRGESIFGRRESTFGRRESTFGRRESTFGRGEPYLQLPPHLEASFKDPSQ